MKVCAAVFAEDLLGADDLSCDAVGVLVFLFAFARVYEPGMYPEEFEIRSFVNLVIFETFKQRRKMTLRHPFDHIVRINNKDWPMSCAQITDALLFLSFQDRLLDDLLCVREFWLVAAVILVRQLSNDLLLGLLVVKLDMLLLRSALLLFLIFFLQLRIETWGRVLH